jgi:hypothetical protein
MTAAFFRQSTILQVSNNLKLEAGAPCVLMDASCRIFHQLPCAADQLNDMSTASNGVGGIASVLESIFISLRCAR